MKKVSVVVPVYNAEKYLDRCVQSILAQTYPCIEVVLVNDGSKDGSLALCKKFAEQDARVKVVDKPNGGAASARNVGIAEATGEYIGFCDSDDYLDSEMMATLVKIMEDEELNTVECVSRARDEDGNIIDEDDFGETLTRYDTRSAVEEIYFRRGSVSLGTRLTKAEFIKSTVIPEGRRVEDFYFTIRLLLKTGGTAVYGKPFYNCVVTKDSVTRSPGGSIYLDALYFYDKANEVIAGNGIDIADAQRYYKLKMYYLLSISTTGQERKRFKRELAQCKADLKKNRSSVRACAYLKKKEKLVLYLASVSMRLARLAYKVKGGKQ